MGSRDERIVEMKFDNAQFESGIAQTTQSLLNLNKSLQMTDGTKAFTGITSAANAVDLSSIVNGVEQLTNRFSLMGIVGMKVMEEVAQYGINIVKNIWNATFGQIKSGGIKRAMNIENAHFMLQGLLHDETEVQRIMGLASDSVDGTAYSYDAAAKAASQFAASGITGNEELATSLRAITGVAAMTNAEYEDISRIFTTVAGNGRLMGDQLLQLSGRGMNAAATLVDFFNGVNDGSKTASEAVTEYVKEITNGAQVTEGEIRDMVSKGKIDFATFSAAMDDAFGEHAKKANETFTGAMSNVKAALSRIGAKFVSPLIEQNGALVQMFNSLRLMINAINKQMDPFANAFVNTVKGGADALKYLMDNINVTDLFKGFAEALRITQTLLAPIGRAFKKAFIVTGAEEGANTIDKINAAITRFKERLESIKPHHSTWTKIQNTFEGLFAVIKIGVQIVSAFIKVFIPLLSGVKDVRSGILDLTSSFGEWLVKLEASLRESNFFVNVFTKIRDVVVNVFTVIVGALQQFWSSTEPFREKFVSIFTGIFEKIRGLDFKGIFNDLKGIFTTELSPTSIGKSTSAIQKLHDILSKLKGILTKVKNTLLSFVKGFTSVIDASSVTSVIVSTFTLAINGLVAVVRYAIDLFAQFGGAIKNAIGGLFEDFNLEKLTDLLSTGAFIYALKKLGDGISAFQATIDIKQLKGIAQSIGILVLSIVALTLIDEEKLSTSLGAITALFTELALAYSVITNGIGGSSDTPTNKIARFLNTFLGLSSLSGLASSIKKHFEMKNITELAKGVLILSGALVLLSTIDTEGMKRGLLAITVLLTELLVTVALLSKVDSKKMDKLWAQVLGVSAGILLISVALKKLGDMDMQSMTNSLVGLGILLGEIVVFMKLTKSNGMSDNFAGAFIELALGILIFGSALAKIGALDMATIGKGLIGIGAGLAAMVIAMKVLSGGSEMFQSKDFFFSKQSGSILKAATAITLVSAAMLMFASALKSIGNMSFEQVVVGLVGIGGALAAVVLAFNYIDNDQLIRSALAITLVGTALLMFASVIQTLGTMSLLDVAQGLIAMGVALGMVVMALSALAGTSGIVQTKDMFFMSKTGSLLKAAAAITVVAVAMNLLAVAVKALGKMDFASLAKGVLTIGVTLAGIVVAINMIDSKGALVAAGAIAAVAASLNLLIPAFVILGNMDFLSILKALIAIMGAILATQTAAVALGPFKTDLLAVTGALALFGVACTAVGVGVLALSTAITSLVVTFTSIPGSIAVLASVIVTSITSIITAVADTIGYLMVGVAKGIVACIEYLAANQDVIVTAITTIFTAVVTALVELIAGAVYLIIETIAETLERLAESNSVGRLVDGFFTIIHQTLIALETHVDEFVTDVVRLFVLVIYSLIKNLGTILSACVEFVVMFVKGLATIIVQQSGPIVEAINDIVLSIAYLLMEVLKELVSVIPGLGALIGNGLEDAQEWIVNHMSEESGSKIIEEWGNGVDKGIQQAGDKWVASARHAALLVTAEARNALGAWNIQGDKSDMIGFQTAQYEPDAYYYNRINRAKYNPDTDYSSTVQPRNIYKGSNYQIDAITRDSKSSLMDSVSTLGQGAKDTLTDSLGDWGNIADMSSDDFTNTIMQNAENAANATDYMGQTAVGSLSYYIPMYGETGSKSIMEYGSMILAGTDRTVKASDTVAGASVGKIAEYYSRYSSTGTNNVDAYIASVYAGQGKASSAGGGVGNANVSGLASVNPLLRSTGSDAISNYATGITGAASKSVSASGQVASSSATAVGQKKSDFWDAGNQATIGFANGITEMISRAISAAGNVARAALSQLKAVLGIHSPSTEFMKAGEYSGEGYIIGLQNYQDAIEKESGNLADLSIKAFSDGMLAISEIADSNSKFEPSIRPVFDLTDVNNGLAALNDMLAPGGTVAMQNTLAASTTVDMASDKDDIWRTMIDENAKHEANLRKIIETQNEVLYSIKRGIANQKVVLDSGELIGQTIEKIDTALEERAVRVGRGN